MSLVVMDEDLYQSISKISSHSYFMPVGRAAWAIFASLKIHNTDKKQVIAMPSFICQSVVAAAVAAFLICSSIYNLLKITPKIIA